MDDDDTPRQKKTYPLSPARMSKTPSWVMLGFVLGAATVATLPPLKKTKPPVSAVNSTTSADASRTEPKPAAPREPQPLTTIEAVFADWAKHAVWEYDTTEVALWNPETKGFTEFFEVLRSGGNYYFRSIPTLTRRVITHGKPLPESPLLFTETEEQYQEWKQHGRRERPVSDYRPPSVPPPPRTTPPTVAPRLEPPRLEPLAPFEPPAVTSPGDKK